MMTVSIRVSALFVLFCPALAPCAPKLPKVIHVDVRAEGRNNGSSWADAYRNLQDALDQIEGTDILSEVHVAQGEYRPPRGSDDSFSDEQATFRIASSVILRGGFAGSLAEQPNVRDVDLHPSILTGDLADDDLTSTARTVVTSGLVGRSRNENSRHVVTILEASDRVILDGLTIRAGHCFNGGDRHVTGAGGAVYSQATHLTIEDCTFEHNFAAEQGGAVYAHEGTLHVEECLFAGNAARSGVVGEGGAIACHRAYVTIVRTFFTANLAVSGGAVLGVDCQELKVSNCLFTGNVATGTGAGLASLGGRVVLRQCTFSENRPSSSLFVTNSEERSATFQIAGCIFPTNTASIAKHFDVVGEIAYSVSTH